MLMTSNSQLGVDEHRTSLAWAPLTSNAADALSNAQHLPRQPYIVTEKPVVNNGPPKARFCNNVHKVPEEENELEDPDAHEPISSKLKKSASRARRTDSYAYYNTGVSYAGRLERAARTVQERRVRKSKERQVRPDAGGMYSTVVRWPGMRGLAGDGEWAGSVARQE
ncbi:hypothetical protein NUW54_g12104 [Trametes sanguinea]|uniref:Uncharacterized protein n=1 Tax=Trametes sanguinea TaxID=158606 RepID=A0ACC1N1S9_9APHY|nr:hypothetical protein NUW54_g12104 [Trametes sanguinea]